MKSQIVHNGRVRPIITQLQDLNLTNNQIAAWAELSPETIRSILGGHPCKVTTYEKLERLLNELKPKKKSFWLRIKGIFS